MAEAIVVLLAATEEEKTYKEDAFQAKICSAWGYVSIGDQGAALETLPSDLDTASERHLKEKSFPALYTQISIVKGAYIKGELHKQLFAMQSP